MDSALGSGDLLISDRYVASTPSFSSSTGCRSISSWTSTGMPPSQISR
ncbi:hypothetical protein [Streptomyces sioyaensis]